MMDCEELQAELLPVFEDLHRHPELGWQEFRTTALLRERLAAAGAELPDTGLKTGLIAVIRGEKPGPVIALRADMDALPVQEETDLPYASEIPGVMHACGHDFHTACMLGAALLLLRNRAELPGTVKVIFQPAEEPCTGARAVAATGLLDDVTRYIAFHTYNPFEPGVVGIREGAVMAAPDFFAVNIQGKGSHAANPQKGADPIPALGAMLTALQTIVSRNTDPFAPAVVTVGEVHAGTANNVIPDTARFTGTVRSLDEGVRTLLRTRLISLVTGIAQAHGVTAEVEWQEGSPALINDPGLCALARKVAAECGLESRPQEPSMGGEDFSCFLQKAPGIFIRIGTGGPWPNHSPHFAADPKALAPAAEYAARLAAAVLEDVSRK